MIILPQNPIECSKNSSGISAKKSFLRSVKGQKSQVCNSEKRKKNNLTKKF